MYYENMIYINVKGFKCSECGYMEYDVLNLNNPKGSIVCSNCGKPLEKEDYESLEIE